MKKRPKKPTVSKVESVNLKDLIPSAFSMDAIASVCHKIALEKGFWESDNDGEKIALMHSELSECLEALRHGNQKDEHCPGFTNAEIELADCVIRIFDFATKKGFSIGQAILEKMSFNMSRPFKHGKRF